MAALITLRRTNLAGQERWKLLIPLGDCNVSARNASELAQEQRDLWSSPGTQKEKIKKARRARRLVPVPMLVYYRQLDAGSSSPWTKMNPIAVPESWYISQLTRAVCNGIVRREGLAAIWPGAARSSDEVPQNLKQALLNNPVPGNKFLPLKAGKRPRTMSAPPHLALEQPS